MPDMRVGLLARPTQPRLAVQAHEARHAVIRGAMDEHALVARRIHDAEEIFEVLKFGCGKIDRNVTVCHAERFHEPLFITKTVAWVEQTEIDHHFHPGPGELAKLIL